VRKLEDRIEERIDLVFELGSVPDAARLVVVDLVIDLGDRELVDLNDPFRIDRVLSYPNPALSANAGE
jgi:hypothetical protein